MTRLQEVTARLAGFSTAHGRHADALEGLARVLESAGGGVAAETCPPVGSLSTGGAGDVGAPPVEFCPIPSKVAFCGTCGDSGRIPNEGPLRWADVRFDEDDDLECHDCPICRECGVELRLHLTEDCP